MADVIDAEMNWLGAKPGETIQDARYRVFSGDSLADIEGFSSIGSTLSDFVARADADTQDVTLLIISDSTAAAAGSWVDVVIPLFAERFPKMSISYTKWVDGSPGTWSPPVVTAGTGIFTLYVYNASVSGMTWQYHFDASRWPTMIASIDADAIVISLGHNDNPGALKINNWRPQRDKALLFTEFMRTLLPRADVVLMSQNPLINYSQSSENRASMLRALARQRGFGFIDVCKAFHDDGRDLATVLIGPDGVHPTTAGYSVWANRFMLETNIAPAGRVTGQLPPAFATPLRNFVDDPIFAGFDGATTPANIKITNATLSKDTVNYETGTFALKVSKVAAGQPALIEITPNVPTARLVGRTVLAIARLRYPSASGTSNCQVAILDSTGVKGSEVWGQSDQFHWRGITMQISPAATVVRMRVYADASTSATLADVTIDRIGLFIGDLPADPA